MSARNGVQSVTAGVRTRLLELLERVAMVASLVPVWILCLDTVRILSFDTVR